MRNKISIIYIWGRLQRYGYVRQYKTRIVYQQSRQDGVCLETYISYGYAIMQYQMMLHDETSSPYTHTWPVAIHHAATKFQYNYS